jgi:hypothetical protein
MTRFWFDGLSYLSNSPNKLDRRHDRDDDDESDDLLPAGESSSNHSSHVRGAPVTTLVPINHSSSNERDRSQVDFLSFPVLKEPDV